MLRKKLFAEFLGTAVLVATVVGSGIMATNLSPDLGIDLLINTVATVFVLYILITLLAPISGAHFNPLVSAIAYFRKELTAAHAIAFFLVQILGGGILAGALGLGVGLLTLKLRGIFFSIATVAVVFILETAVNNWRYVGGATGLQLTRPQDLWFFDSYVRMLFFVMAVLAVISVAIARYVQDSFLGRGLRAVRDSEEAAECSGVPTLKIKLIACTISGALMGIAGAPMPMYLSYIEPSSTFNLSYSIYALGMPIIGGTSHWIGPVIGALLLATLQQIVTVTVSNELNVLIVGVLLVLFVVIAPEGILGLIKKWKQSSK